MGWKTKALIFRALSLAPLGDEIHYLLQRHVTREWPRRAATLDDLLAAAQRVHDAARGSGGDFLEIGAGRDLAVAVSLRLLGVPRVTCVDVSALARPELISHAATHIAMRLGVPAPQIDSWNDLKRFGITYLAPTDLQRAGIESSSIDCFYSIDTLEHIPPRELRATLTEAKRILRPSGICVHAIDYSDHYARSDNELSRFNFLMFTEPAWRPFNSRFQYVNRLRHCEYVRLFSDVGLPATQIQAEVVPPQQSILERLAPEFQAFQVADLFTLRAFVVCGTG